MKGPKKEDLEKEKGRRSVPKKVKSNRGGKVENRFIIISVEFSSRDILEIYFTCVFHLVV